MTTRSRSQIDRNLMSRKLSMMLLVSIGAAALSCLVFPAAIALSQDHSLSGSASAFQQAFETINKPGITKVQYNYVMTGRVRLVLFWAGADDVGGGYIRRAQSAADPKLRITQVLFGSDPSKAPRKINHWGAATEAKAMGDSIFMGFMTSANTSSAAKAEEDKKTQAERGQYPFQAIMSVLDADRAVSRTIVLSANKNLNIHEYDEATRLVAEHLKAAGPIRELAGTRRKCGESIGFLEATDELINRVLSGGKAPQSVCYIHNARNYTLTLEERSNVKSKSIHLRRKDGKELDRNYRDLIRASFSTFNHDSGERSTFELLLGNAGELRGVPVQIVHQPNWWFQVELNLESSPSGMKAN